MKCIWFRRYRANDRKTQRDSASVRELRHWRSSKYLQFGLWSDADRCACEHKKVSPITEHTENGRISAMRLHFVGVATVQFVLALFRSRLHSFLSFLLLCGGGGISVIPAHTWVYANVWCQYSYVCRSCAGVMCTCCIFESSEIEITRIDHGLGTFFVLFIGSKIESFVLRTKSVFRLMFVNKPSNRIERIRKFVKTWIDIKSDWNHYVYLRPSK